MFKRSFIAKYRAYTKTLKTLQEKATTERTTTLRIKYETKYEKLNDSFKNVLQNGKNFTEQNKVLSIAHNKLSEKLQSSKEKCVNLTQNLRGNRFLNPKLFCAAAIVKADPNTISGYSQQDYEILQQLGIVTNNSSTNFTNSASSTITPASETNVPDSDAFITSNHDLSASTFNSINDPPSLFDTQTNYTSIFDNMPQERNDLYTTFTNAFSNHSEKSTQTANDQHLQFEPAQEFNTFTNDFFVVETPGVEKSGTNEASAELINETITTNQESNAFNVASGAGESGSQSEVLGADFGVGSNNISDDNNVVTNSIDNVVIEPIPEPPSLPDLAAEAASQVNALGEATFASLGLGGYTPVGIVQNCFEFLHVSLGIPWWEAIAIGTLVIRFALFPLVVIAQRNAAKMNNHLPQMQVIQLKMTEARQSGNQMEVARYSQELMLFMKEKNLNPLKNMVVPLVQMPVFVSFFMGLREMANVPVDSLRTGGMFWFSDLTVPDQFFALPFITSLTLWATIELGTDSARLSSQNLQTMKYVLRALPWVILPFTVNFPGAILCYWLASNVISLGQVGFLKIPAVRDYFNIDPMLKHDQSALPIKNKGFVGGIKDSWTNIKITKEIEERRRLDELQFQRAGKGPLVKTYKYDPTKQVKKTSSTSSAKSAIKNSS